eukprot:6976446-Alexandrium_andersonii.AAC.1
MVAGPPPSGAPSLRYGGAALTSAQMSARSKRHGSAHALLVAVHGAWCCRVVALWSAAALAWGGVHAARLLA